MSEGESSSNNYKKIMDGAVKANVTSAAAPHESQPWTTVEKSIKATITTSPHPSEPQPPSKTKKI